MIPWLTALIPSAFNVVASKPWEAKPTVDQAPVVARPDNTPIIVIGIIGLAVIILVIVILSKKS